MVILWVLVELLFPGRPGLLDGILEDSWLPGPWVPLKILGALLTAGLAIAAEALVLRRAFRGLPHTRHRGAILWITANALIALLCGGVLAGILYSPLLDAVRADRVAIATIVCELAVVFGVVGALISRARRVRLVRGVAIVAAMNLAILATGAVGWAWSRSLPVLVALVPGWMYGTVTVEFRPFTGAEEMTARELGEEVSPEGDLCRLPVACYLVKTRDAEAWVILCKWGLYGGDLVDLSHIHLWVVDARSGALLAQERCM